MALEVVAGPGTEMLRDEVVSAVRSALGSRIDAGDWLLIMEKDGRGIVVDLTNRNGVMRQWFFETGDPIGSIIQEGLSAPS